jgi:hypothetical protein
VKGIYFYLYLIMNIFSRKIVGWWIYDVESSELASQVVREICERENIAPDQVVLHSDNGSPMKGATMLATLQALGVMPSFVRPSVSNDNPFSESLFKTLKYRPVYPRRAIDACWRRGSGSVALFIGITTSTPQRDPFRDPGTAPRRPGRGVAPQTGRGIPGSKGCAPGALERRHAQLGPRFHRLSEPGSGEQQCSRSG